MTEYDEDKKPKNLEEEISKINILELITISDSNKSYKAWKGFVVLHSLVSSYFYAYMAAFKSPTPDHHLFKVMLYFEFIFFCEIVFKFFEEFTKDGQTIPTRSLSLSVTTPFATATFPVTDMLRILSDKK